MNHLHVNQESQEKKLTISESKQSMILYSSPEKLNDSPTPYQTNNEASPESLIIEELK